MKKQDEKPPHLFPGDSPASPFPAPGNKEDLRTNGIYGPKCSALSGNCTPLGCLEKMLLASSIWGSTRRFLTWSRQATPLGFSYFLLSPSAHGMSAKELSSSAIARALITKPAIVLADEPTGNLDSKTSAEVLGLIKRTSAEFRQTVVMITHNNDIARLADRIVRIEDGKIVE